MSEYPTQDFVRKEIAEGRWPAREGDILDIRSLSDKEVKIIELYNQEEIIKQQRITNRLMAELVNEKQKGLGYKIRDILDDGKLNNSAGRK